MLEEQPVFYTAEELDTKIAKNLPNILNQTPTVEQKVIGKSHGNLSGLEQRITHVLSLLVKAKPVEVYKELNANYPSEYTNKQITNKMWAMEKKHILAKDESGAYYVESDTQG